MREKPDRRQWQEQVTALSAKIFELRSKNRRLRTALATAEAERDAAHNAALDAANAYMIEQYGIAALGHPVDRARVLSKLKKETPNADK